MMARWLGLARFALALAGLSALGFAAAPAVAAEATYWLPADVELDGAAARLDLYYNGESGRLVRPQAGATLDLSALGATRLAPASGETLYAYLVADAAVAEFEAPARVLLRSGHEVIVATAGQVPRLTTAAAAVLPGLKQPVRIPAAALPWPQAAAAPAPLRDREVDPLIQEMVGALTTANYMATWHELEDFVTRYTFAPQNVVMNQWIRDEFSTMGLAVELHSYQQDGTRYNVIATLPGQVDPTQVVYICAHMDAISDTPYSCAPGADDNGSGAAAVIEAARILRQYPFSYTIKFALWNGEEQGLVGSGEYVQDIAAAGEDVIAAFNMDMIAYRGTDAAPADLVIYTNSASQPYANILATACNDYVPGTLQPIVRVENLSGSDHYSFWSYGFRAVTAIEDEAWGDDFCPWYHTCSDLIAQYPQDYVLNCAKANLAAVAETAVPIDPSGPYLVVQSTAIDDDATPPSAGDDDGILNPGETVELWVTVRNVGSAAATGVTGTLASTSPAVTILGGSAPWNDIPAGGQGSNTAAFVFSLDGSAPDGEVIPFTLTMNNTMGSQELPLQLAVVAPDLAFRSYRIDDATLGNGNGIPDPGELLLVPVTLANRGNKDAAEVSALLASGTPLVTVLDAQAASPLIAAGDAEELSPGFSLRVSQDAPVGALLPLDLAIATAIGYEAASGFQLKVGAVFFDDCEVDGAWSLSAAGDNASSGLWVRVDPNGTTYNGLPAQAEDDHTAAPGVECFVTGQGAPGGPAGDTDVDGGQTTLSTPAFDISTVIEPRVTYWRWYTNNLGNNPGEDTWLVQVSANGGATWVDLERTTASANSWQQRSFLLADFIAPSAAVRFRFIASDAGAGGSLVEAAVDDFEVTGLTQPVTGAGDFLPTTLRLAPPRPNPCLGDAQLAFTLPAAGQAVLRVYSVDGRRVATLVDRELPAGQHGAIWNGRDEAGHAVAPGVYFTRLEAGGKTLSRKLVLLH
jgi:hypothetical protein